MGIFASAVTGIIRCGGGGGGEARLHTRTVSYFSFSFSFFFFSPRSFVRSTTSLVSQRFCQRTRCRNIFINHRLHRHRLHLHLLPIPRIVAAGGGDIEEEEEGIIIMGSAVGVGGST